MIFHLLLDIVSFHKRREKFINIKITMNFLNPDFEKAIKLSQENENILVQKGIDLDSIGFHKEAIGSFDAALKLNPNNIEALYRRGCAFGNLGNIRKALLEFEQVLKLKPKHKYALHDKGLALCRLSRDEEAVACFNQSLEIDPNHLNAWNDPSVALAKLNRFKEIIDCCDNALKLDSKLFSFWDKKAASYIELEKYDEAIICCSKALEINSNYSNSYINRGNAFYKLGHYVDAKKDYEEAIQLDNSIEAWVGKGNVLGKLRFYEEAVDSYDHALRIDPKCFQAWKEKAGIFEKLSKFDQAIESLEKAINLQPTTLELAKLFHIKGHTYENLKNFKGAIASYEKALEIHSDNPQVWCCRGSALLSFEDFEEASASYDEALTLTQNQFWRAWYGKGIVVLRWQGYRAAVKICDDALQSFLSAYSDFYYGSGKLHHLKGSIIYDEGRKQQNLNWLEARDAYLKALEYLTIERFPQDHLDLLQEMVTIRTSLFSSSEIEELLDQATAKLENLLHKPGISAGQKISLKTKFAKFSELQVYRLVLQDKSQALNLAEKHKNRCLERLHNGYKPYEPNFAKIQTLLNSQTASIYWHLSPAALTTFILKYNFQPQILELPTDNTQESHKTNQDDYYTLIAEQIRRFEDWMKRWKTLYLAHQESIGVKTNEPSQWQLNIQSMLLDDELSLRKILEIDRICEEYLQDVDHVILIPHRDLHLLPLHALFPDHFTITYLPSAQIGLDLQHRNSLAGDRILCVEAPTVTSSVANKKNLDSLPFAKREVEGISYLYNSANNTLISGQSASKDTILASLNTVHDCFHFTGHGFHNTDEPLQSALALSGDDRLTLEQYSGQN
jgi:tetratricopeptide (TPR) repeat protein/CHAT domain-containing protein